jgi:hypothetical protein
VNAPDARFRLVHRLRSETELREDSVLHYRDSESRSCHLWRRSGRMTGHPPEKRIAHANLKSHAVGAMLVSPALQRGVSVSPMTVPESRRDSAFSPHTFFDSFAN